MKVGGKGLIEPYKPAMFVCLKTYKKSFDWPLVLFSWQEGEVEAIYNSYDRCSVLDGWSRESISFFLQTTSKLILFLNICYNIMIPLAKSFNSWYFDQLWLIWTNQKSFEPVESDHGQFGPCISVYMYLKFRFIW